MSIREVYSESDERKAQYSVPPETVFDKANRIWDEFQQPTYKTSEQLRGAIEAAEHVLFACGTLVEMAQHDLDNAKLAQRMSRDRVMELRQQLIAMEVKQ